MKCFPRILAAFAALSSVSGFADAPKLTGFPFQDETLQFNVNWPTGISMGKATMQAKRVEDERWEFVFTLDASIPGFTITDRYRSVANRDLCSIEFERESTHGAKKARETVTFQADRNMARRVTKSGGSSDFRTPSCAKDALTFFYFTRVEMGQGRVPLPTTVVLGGPYEINLNYPGEESLKNVVTDKLVAVSHGPSSNVSFDILFARDAARSPLLVRTPFSLGTFSLELIR